MAKCKECRWLNGKRTNVGIECMNPAKQKHWSELDRMRISVGGGPAKARYKQPNQPACKKFEELI